MSDDHIARTRTAYGDSASRFASTVGTTISPMFEAPVDRALLHAFAELAHESNGTVIDAGCGPGRVARFLADRHLDVVGIDVAPGMIEAARTAHPDVRFEVAELTRLPVDDATLAGVAYWYSIITTPPEGLDPIWAELDRTLSSDGIALIAFHCGAGEPVVTADAFGTSTDLTLFHHDVDHVCSGIESASLHVDTVARRARRFDHEPTDQAFIIATRADPTAEPDGHQRAQRTTQ